MSANYSSQHRWLWGLLLVGATILVYWPALHGGFVWDDDVHISANTTLRSVHGLREIWFEPGATCQYYPLTFTGFWLGYHLWGLNTFGFHLLNVLTHALAALLLWQVLARLRVPGAPIAAAIFALHPVNVMSVAWMTEFKNTLSATLALGSTWAFLRFAGSGALDVGEKSPVEREAKKSARYYYALSLLLFVLAMFAKTATSFLPVTLLLLIWWQRGRLSRRDSLPVIPLFGIAVAMGTLTIYVEQHSGGAYGNQFNLNLVERLLVSGRSFWFYLGKLIFPYPLTFVYERWQIDPAIWWQYLYPLATAALLIGLWLARRRVGMGPWVAAMHFYISTSMLILVVVLYMTRYTFVSDHWQYFGCMSVIALAAAGIAKLSSWSKGLARSLGAVAVIALLSILGTLTWRQCAIYRDAETLWRATLAQNPNSWFAHNNLGAVLLKMGNIEEATAHLQRGLEINPNVAETHNGIAAVLLRLGRVDDALVHLRKAVEIQPVDAEAQGNLGVALLQAGRLNEAIAQLEKTLTLDPDYIDAHTNLGNALLQVGRVQESLAHLQKALEIDPDYATAHFNLANTLLKMGRAQDALAHWQKALTIDPDDADTQNNMAWVLATWPDAPIRNGARAVELAERANQLTGNRNPAIGATLAAAYAEAGRFSDAIKTAQDALQLASDSGNRILAEEIRAQLVLYQSGQPFRDRRRP